MWWFDNRIRFDESNEHWISPMHLYWFEQGFVACLTIAVCDVCKSSLFSFRSNANDSNFDARGIFVPAPAHTHNDRLHATTSTVTSTLKGKTLWQNAIPFMKILIRNVSINIKNMKYWLIQTCIRTLSWLCAINGAAWLKRMIASMKFKCDSTHRVSILFFPPFICIADDVNIRKFVFLFWFRFKSRAIWFQLEFNLDVNFSIINHLKLW